MERFTIDLHGPLHGMEYGGEGQLVLLVHGLSGSAVNWVETAVPLTAYGRVVAPELPGFGRTPPAGRSASMKAQAGLMADFIEYQGGGAGVGDRELDGRHDQHDPGRTAPRPGGPPGADRHTGIDRRPGGASSGLGRQHADVSGAGRQPPVREPAPPPGDSRTDHRRLPRTAGRRAGADVGEGQAPPRPGRR